ncbi:hypothetical protein [Actinocorallia sp. A-T 12471]|uniref:hypothetical protein n=1 Tax=Actinocorallia sp. A-T 12471 TaxID=3089813 RepID=UPI0029D356F2|nr:hypothetical protein [Actinocorallia sp. A-T 12471]MDX6738613.1 hypothetical protein [Actinocorallia sp. A-T 12471]
MEEITQADATAYGLELPDGWTLWKRVPMGSDLVEWLLIGVYTVLGWRVEIVADLSAPYTGPSAVNVTPGDGDAESDGVTLDVLRAVPLGDARKVLSEWSARVIAAVTPERGPLPLPESVTTPHDYAVVAAAYVALVNAGERRPIHRMAESSGASRNTISARVRRARDRQYIVQTGTGAKLRAELSARAIEILNEQEK